MDACLNLDPASPQQARCDHLPRHLAVLVHWAPHPLRKLPDRRGFRRLLRETSALRQLHRGDEPVQLGQRRDQPPGAGRGSVGAARAGECSPPSRVFHAPPSRSHRVLLRSGPGPNLFCRSLRRRSLWAISVPGHTGDDIEYLVNGCTPVLLTGDAGRFACA